MKFTDLTTHAARGALGALALGGLILTTSCGDDDEAEAAPVEDADLTVEAHDIDFDRDSYRLSAGSPTIAYVQEGATRHTLVIETEDGEDVSGFKLDVNGHPSDTDSVDLEAGTYNLYCDVAGHRDAGMEAELIVE